jgi:hypothetical protein
MRAAETTGQPLPTFYFWIILTFLNEFFSYCLAHPQGASEIRVLILTSGRIGAFMELFSITFLRKSNTN